MGIFDFSSGGQKSTQPWDKQYGLWTLLSLISPEFGDAFKSAKPNMFKQVFEKSAEDERAASPLVRLLSDYDPFSFITQLGRPTTGAEQSLMDRSLFGAAAPLDLSQAYAQAGNLQELLKNFSPASPGGGALGQGYQGLLSAVGGPMGQNLPQAPPQRPQAPSIPPPNMGMFGLGKTGPASMSFTGGGNLFDWMSPYTNRPQFV